MGLCGLRKREPPDGRPDAVHGRAELKVVSAEACRADVQMFVVRETRMSAAEINPFGTWLPSAAVSFSTTTLFGTQGTAGESWTLLL